MAPENLIELFSAFGPVSVRRMFGGAGIYADGMMFGLVADGVIYLKSGASNATMFDREGLQPFGYSSRRGDRILTSYRRMPERLYDEPDELAIWARAALAEAQQRAVAKAAPKRLTLRRSQPAASRIGKPMRSSSKEPRSKVGKSRVRG